MKAEERKGLVTNTLAKTLTNTLEGLKEGPSRNTVLFLVIIALVLILVFTWRYFAQAARETDSNRWLEWDNLTVPDQLSKYIDNRDLQATTQGRLARFLAARRALSDGVKNIGQKGELKKFAIKDLETAAAEYGKLVDECKDQVLLEQEAMLNAGRALEGLTKWSAARSSYQQLAAKYPDTVRGKTAQKRLEQLDEGDPANKKVMEDLKKDFDEPVPSAPPAGGPPLPPSR